MTSHDGFSVEKFYKGLQSPEFAELREEQSDSVSKAKQPLEDVIWKISAWAVEWGLSVYCFAAIAR
ncbi:hypothetical protein [Thermoleptolyngbya sp.]|jgi:hypothetical protein